MRRVDDPPKPSGSRKIRSEKMKESTRKLLEQVDEEHDWIKGQTYSGGGTEYHSTDECQVCGLRRHYQSDQQNGIEAHYRFSLGDADLSLLEALNRGCENSYVQNDLRSIKNG